MERGEQKFSWLISAILMVSLLSGLGIALFVKRNQAQASSSESADPGSITEDSSNGGSLSWNSTGNISQSDDQYATVNLMGWSKYLKMTQYGFSIPSGATITGVEVEIERFAGSAFDESIRLVKANTISGDEKAKTEQWPDSDGTATYGGSSDLWGLSLTPTDINSQDFGLAFAVRGMSSKQVDYIKLKIYYSVTYTITASAGSHGTISPGGSISVQPGANQLFTISADSDYRIASLLIDGLSVGTDSSYEFVDINSNHTIEATFELITATTTTTTEDSGSDTGDNDGSTTTQTGEESTTTSPETVTQTAPNSETPKNNTSPGVSTPVPATAEPTPVVSIDSTVSSPSPDTTVVRKADSVSVNSKTRPTLADQIRDVFAKIHIPRESVPEVLSAVGLSGVGVSTLTNSLINFSTLFSFSEYLRSIYLSIISLFFSRRKTREWGKVIEEGTGLPIAQAKVSLIALSEVGSDRIIANTYTDKRGNYGFVVGAGSYKLEIMKNSYTHKSGHGFYFPDETLTILDNSGHLVVPDIMLAIDNQALNHKFSVVLFLKRLEKVLVYLSLLLLLVGSYLVTESFLAAPNVATGTILIVYVIIWFIQIMTLFRKSPWGRVVEKSSEKPLPLTLIRVFNKSDNRLIRTSVSDNEGKFSVLVHKGKYEVVAAKAGYVLHHKIAFNAAEHLNAFDQKIQLDRENS